MPFGLGPNVSVLFPPCSVTAETSVQVPTSSLAVWANASPATRTTPRDNNPSAPIVPTCFMALLPLRLASRGNANALFPVTTLGLYLLSTRHHAPAHVSGLSSPTPRG